ncbi:MAG: CHASE4 domain-containing protein [Thermoleophilia bacterium]
MTLRNKTVTIFGVTLIALLLALLVASSTTLLGGFTDLEEEETRSDVQRTVSALNDDQNTFSKTTRHWASWDDTYAFVEDRNQAYVDSNLMQSSSWTNNHVNLMAYINANGQPVYAKAYGLAGNTPAEVSEGAKRLIVNNPDLQIHPTTEHDTSGYVMLPEGPMLVASQPILTSNSEGPVRGTLIWGRYLNAEEIARLARLTSLNLDFFDANDTSQPQDITDGLAGMSPASPIAVKVLNSDTIAGYTVISDINQSPAMVLRVQVPRTVFQQGKTTMRYTVASLLFSGLIFCGISLFLLERTVISRVSRISHDVEDIGDRVDPSTRLVMTGDDELSQLGSGINKMLSALEDSQQELSETGSQEMSRREELSALYDLSRQLADTSTDFDTILKLVTKHAVETIHVTYAEVVLVEGDDLVVHAIHPRRALQNISLGRRFRLDPQSFSYRCMRSSEPRTVGKDDGLLSHEEKDMLFQGSANMVCITPLRLDDRASGMIVFGEERSEEREPFTKEKLNLARSVGEQTASALRRAELFNELETAYLQTVLALANAVEAKDTYTMDHAQKLALQATAIGQEMNLSQMELEDLRFGAILHDIGKIGMPDRILQKTTRLEEEEWLLMKEHPIIGERILSPVRRLHGAARIVRSHHERFDGEGYPDGLAGKDIPVGARILTAVDSYGAMIDKRVYKEAMPASIALAEMKRCSGTQFDPAVIEIFVRLLESGKIG